MRVTRSTPKPVMPPAAAAATKTSKRPAAKRAARTADVFETGAPAEKRVSPAWIGNATVQISRGSPGGVKPLADAFTFDSWARQRADTTKVSFEVWQPGMTDRDNPDLWKQLDVQVFVREGGGNFKKQPVNLECRTGNNARYGVDVRQFDPFATEKKANKGIDKRSVEFYFVVNGKELRAPSGKPFKCTFER